MSRSSDPPRARRSRFLPFALPDFDEREPEAVREVLQSGWITTGERAHAFEIEFAAAVGAKHAIAVNSCTAALHLALDAIGLRSGEEVLVPAYTFAATAEVVRYFDARPVFVDIDRRSMNVDPERIVHAITPRTRAIIPVHFAGLPADMSAITGIARDHGLAVIEDAAHAFPASYEETKIGSLSDFACFSFYATKSITTGEGGMICTNDDARADRCRIMALHGISRDAWKRYAAEGSWYYEIIAPGYKYNMTDIAAAIGLVQLSKAEMMWRRRREIAERYTEAFSRMPELETPVAGGGHAWHLYPLRLNLDRLTIDRATFVEELRKLNIGTSVHFIPLHMHPYYRQLYGFGPRDFPVAHDEYLREVSLPVYSKMTDEDARDVIDAVQAVVEKSLAKTK